MNSRIRLAVKAKVLGRRSLDELETLVTPGTLFAGHRTRTARKGTYARRGPGRPRVVQEITDLALRIAYLGFGRNPRRYSPSARDAARPWRLAGLCVRNPANPTDQGVTVTVVVADMLPTVTVMVSDPGFFAVASPLLTVALLTPTTRQVLVRAVAEDAGRRKILSRPHRETGIGWSDLQGCYCRVVAAATSVAAITRQNGPAESKKCQPHTITI
jgi:hypothetical protein